jgi:hypothetical protein
MTGLDVLVLYTAALVLGLTALLYSLDRSLRTTGRPGNRDPYRPGPARDPAAALSAADTAAAVAEAVAIVTAAARRRPCCWRCRERMARDARGDFWHCTALSCPGSLLSTDSSPLWAPEE